MIKKGLLIVVSGLLAIYFFYFADLYAPQREMTSMGLKAIASENIKNILRKENDASMVSFKLNNFEIVDRKKRFIPTKELFNSNLDKNVRNIPLSDKVVVYTYNALIDVEKAAIPLKEKQVSQRKLSGKLAFRELLWANIRIEGMVWISCDVPE